MWYWICAFFGGFFAKVSSRNNEKKLESVNIMVLKRYGMLLKKYLKELSLMKCSRLTIDGSLMDFLYNEEKYLYKYEDMLVQLFLKY